MLKLENVPPEQMPEVVRIASEMYERDQQRNEEAQLRQATVKAAEEVGLPEEYLHRAAAEMHSRKVEELQQKRRTRNRLIAATSAAAIAVLLTFGLSRLNTPPASLAPPAAVSVNTPFVYSLMDNGTWRGERNAGTQAHVAVHDGKIEFKVEKFVPNAQGTYFVNADTHQLPPALEGYQAVKFRVQGTGLNNVRFYFENGPTERWRSRPVPVTSAAQEVTLPLSEFEYLTRPSADSTFKRQAYQPPGKVERLSIKAGDFVNDVNARGSMTIENLTIE
jgi:hypothetical protein